ncbi:MAG: carboxylesterase family protein [Polaribacter sp.]|uniref:carboxylesterase family protein n=1 Tax=Polaribacter sp. TaxID=1920175 RepID=UPI003BB02A47
MKNIFFFSFLFCYAASFSQTLYLDKVATVGKKTLIYKEIREGKNLKLDFYNPKKIEGKRPLLLYVHGGGFSGGKRNSRLSVYFSNEMASHGYAVASISYRLTMQKLGFGCSTKSASKIKAFNDASEDISYAIQYLIENSKSLNIDVDKIILVGSSAGAEAILNLAYVYDNKILPKDFKFAGIIGMAGAITTLRKINKKTAIPTQLFHGISDSLVPYNIAPHHYCDKNSEGYLKLYGAKAIANKLKSLNASFYLYSVKNGNHTWSTRPLISCRKEILDFLYYDVLKDGKRQKETFVKS